MLKTKILICGGGIVGLAIAYRLLEVGCEDILIIEKEDTLGCHATGRNSGILHAGIYYAPDTLKARFCLEGNFLLREFCKKSGIAVHDTGKVVVAKNEAQLETLRIIFERAKKNGAKVDLIDKHQLREIEPYARTHKQAVYSHYTGAVNSKAVLGAFYDQLIASQKVQLRTGVRFLTKKGDENVVITNQGEIRYDTFINAAGAFSDRVAHSFGLGHDYVLIPFKGTYKRLKKEKAHMVNGNIYPVPDIRNPFLGTHLSKNTDGEVTIGPTAIPAFGRENYHVFEGLGRESVKIMYQDMVLFFVNAGFRNVAVTEPKKYLFSYFFKDVRALIRDVTEADIEDSPKVGIRPQLVNWPQKKLEMDFLIVRDASSVHVLNAISPAFTSSLSFAKHLVDNYLGELVKNA